MPTSVSGWRYGVTNAFTSMRSSATDFYGLRRDGHSLREIWLAYFTHLGLGWVFSASWLKCLWNHRSPFLRTNKFLSRRVPGFIRAAIVELALGCALLTAGVVLAVSDFLVGPLTACLMCGARFAVVWIWRQMRHTFQLTCELQEVSGSDLLPVVSGPRSTRSHRGRVSPTERAQEKQPRLGRHLSLRKE